MGVYPTLTITDDNGNQATLPVCDLYNIPVYGKDSANIYWGPYMMKSPLLTSSVKSILSNEFNQISNGGSRSINITQHVDIENGEAIIGHQYLHGSNRSVGDFKITGSTNKDTSGKVTANLHFEWNDVIDPNFQYDTDLLKAQIAQQIPGSNIQNYIIKIAWDFKMVKNITEPSWWEFWKESSTWPYED